MANQFVKDTIGFRSRTKFKKTKNMGNFNFKGRGRMYSSTRSVKTKLTNQTESWM